MNVETILFKFPIGEILERFKPLIADVVAKEFEKHKLTLNAGPDDLLTRKEVTKLLGLSLPTITRYTKTGLLKGYRIGMHIRYKRKEVLEALQQISAFKNLRSS